MVKKWINKDFIAGIVILIFSVWVYVTAESMPLEERADIPPNFFPKFLAVVLGILSIALILKAIKDIVEGIQEAKGEKINVQKILLLIVFIALYTYFLRDLGFIVTSVIYLIAMMKLLGGHLIKIVPIAVISVFVIYYIFGIYFYVALP